ncbi:hypothetical protein, partial [Paraglaciecola sp.]|uniref:hypothetical protein n=1 Tax=Paraglaciecola sp. TaxID=1920173 RepID=UPI0030F466DA
ILETARLLAALIRPNHLVRLSSWGLILLPSPCNSNDFGYSSIFLNALSSDESLKLIELHFRISISSQFNTLNYVY